MSLWSGNDATNKKCCAEEKGELHDANKYIEQVQSRLPNMIAEGSRSSILDEGALAI
jgi:hypothetical protein